MIILYNTVSKVNHLSTQQIVDKSITFVKQAIFMHSYACLKEVITKNFKLVDLWSNRQLVSQPYYVIRPLLQ